MIDQTLSSKMSNMGVVCAVLVVLCHIFPDVKVGSFTWCIDRFINDGVGRAAVPYFFIVSGYFLARHIGEDGWWKRAVRDRLRTLIVPHLIWNFLWLLMPIAFAVAVNLLKGRSLFFNIVIPSWGGGIGTASPWSNLVYQNAFFVCGIDTLFCRHAQKQC